MDWLIRMGALDTVPNRIALSTALRGTIPVMSILVGLPLLGLSDHAGIAALGAMGTAMVDIGGLYLTRLTAMGATAVLGAALLMLGIVIAPHLWVAAILAAMVGMSAGLARAVGPMGVPAGLNVTTAFLIGIQSGDVDGGTAAQFGFDYLLGGVWAAAITVAFWQVRPYRRIELEIAGAWEEVAGLVLAALGAAEAGATVVARRGRERDLALHHRSFADSLERAQIVLGEMTSQTVGGSSVTAQLYVLHRAAIRVAGAALTLAEAGASDSAEEHTRRRLATAALVRACRLVARALTSGRAAPAFEDLHRLAEPTGNATDALAFAQALRHLDSAAEALRQVFAHRDFLGGLHAMFIGKPKPRLLLDRLRAHLTTQSLIFRHAVRVAVVSVVALVAALLFHLPHGIWLPMTAAVVLQPEYGNTARRAWQRSLGTAAGAMVAAVLLEFLRGTDAFLVAIALLLLAMFTLLRKSYGLAITFLTPLVILLLKLSGPDPWSDLLDRIVYTIAGGCIAMAAIHVLWPQWERERIGARLARAVNAERAYLSAVFKNLFAPGVPADMAQLRREAEMAIGNADTAFQTMLAEPASRRARFGAPFQALVNAHRLCRHAIALAALSGDVALDPGEGAEYVRLLDAALADVADSLDKGHPPAARPDIDPALAQLNKALAAAEGPGGTAAMLMGRITSDMTGLNASIH